MATTRTPARWTVMVFLNAKNNLEPFAFPNFAQMASVGSTDEVHVLVQFGRPKKHYTTESGGWSRTLRFRVERGMKPTVANALEDLGDVNMGAPQALVDFVRWSKANYPADRYMLVLWDHGQGWRAGDPTLGGQIVAEPAAPVWRSTEPGAAVVQTAPGVGYRHVSHDEDTGDKLYNRQIQDSLGALLGADKLDVISFDACLMAMVETGYALRGLAQVMVGSEELEPGSGWDYKRWLAPLVADPAGHDGAALGASMVAAYKDAYGNNDDTTLSAVDLSQIEAVVGAVNAVADAVLADPTQLGALRQARLQCSSYAPGHPLSSIDLKRLMDCLADPASGGSEFLRARASEASAAVSAAVFANHSALSRQGSFGSHGMGIYFPKSQQSFLRDPDREGYLESNTIHPVEFVQTGRWAWMLQSYLARYPTD